MGDAFGQVLVLSVAVALSPIPIIGVILMLSTPRARSTGPAFVAGWMLGLSAIGAVVLFASRSAGASEQGEPAGWVAILMLALGALLLALAVKQWSGRPRDGEQAELPAWIRKTDNFTAAEAAGFGVLLSALNPKNLVLTIAAAAAIAETGAPADEEVIALALFVVLGSLGTGLPVACYYAFGERSQRTLDDLREWMTQNNATIMAVLLLLIGAKLIGDGIGGL